MEDSPQKVHAYGARGEELDPDGEDTPSREDVEVTLVSSKALGKKAK